jgi:hypothetical protein
MIKKAKAGLFLLMFAGSFSDRMFSLATKLIRSSIVENAEGTFALMLLYLKKSKSPKYSLNILKILHHMPDEAINQSRVLQIYFRADTFKSSSAQEGILRCIMVLKKCFNLSEK